MSTTYLYTRVSTNKQDTMAQEQDLIKRYPEGIVFRETASGAKARPVLQAVMQMAQEGDTLVVVAIDRLGRKTAEVLTNIENLVAKKVNVITLREGINYSTPAGRLVTQILASVAEMEREMTRDRTRATLQALKAKGVKLGPKPKFTEDDVASAREMLTAGHTYREISKATGISIGRLSKLFREAEVQAA